MSSFRRTTTTTTSSTFGRPRTVTTTTTHNTSGDDAVSALLELAEILLRASNNAAQRKDAAIKAMRHARQCQLCALGSKDGTKGPSSAQNQTDMIEKALQLAEKANQLDSSVVPTAHVRALRELARDVKYTNLSRVTPSTSFRHTAIG